MKAGFDRLCQRLTPDNWASFCAFLYLTAFVLFVPTTGYSNIVFPKHCLFLGLTALLLAGCLPRIRGRRLRRWPLALAGALLLLFFLSAAASPYPQTAWLGNRRREGLVTLGLYVGIFVTFCLWGELGKWHIRGTAIASALIFVLVLIQFLGYNPLGLYPQGLCFHDRSLRYSGEYLGTIGNADLLSAYLTMAVLFLLGAYAAGKEGGVALLGGGCAWGALLLSEVSAGPVAIGAALAVCLPLCVWKGIGLGRMGQIAGVLALGILGKSLLGYDYSNGTLTLFYVFGRIQAGLLVLALACFGARFLLRKLPKGRGYGKAAMALVLIMVLVLLLVLGFFFFYSGENETFQAASLLLHGDPPDTLGSSRVAIWKEALAMGLEAPLLGSGPDTYQLRSELIFTRELPDGQVRRTSVDAAHNEYLNLWVNTGLPSALVFLALLASVLLPAMKDLDQKRLYLLLPTLGYAVHALFGISQSLVSPLFYLFLGALARTRKK